MEKLEMDEKASINWPKCNDDRNIPQHEEYRCFADIFKNHKCYCLGQTYPKGWKCPFYKVDPNYNPSKIDEA